jgi:hypothetical protein
MANKHENLNSLFTNFADAIRERTGGTAKIIADDFPDEIRAINTSAGGGGNVETCSVIFTSRDGVEGPDYGVGRVRYTTINEEGNIEYIEGGNFVNSFNPIKNSIIFCDNYGNDWLPINQTGNNFEILYNDIMDNCIIVITGDCRIKVDYVFDE